MILKRDETPEILNKMFVAFFKNLVNMKLSWCDYWIKILNSRNLSVEKVARLLIKYFGLGFSDLGKVMNRNNSHQYLLQYMRH